MRVILIRRMNNPANKKQHLVGDTSPREMWDLYNRDGEPQGRTIVRGDQLNDGDYHLVVQIWVKNARGEYLIQKRADHVKQAPGVWATTAGSVVAGETSRIGATRELAEELGIRAFPHELRKMYQDASRFALGTAWLLERDVALNEIRLQADEVAETMWADQALIRKMVEQGLFYDYGDEYFRHVFKNREDIASDGAVIIK